MKINEIKQGVKFDNIELNVEVVNVGEQRFLVKCFKCKFESMVNESEYKGKCPGCGTKESKKPGDGLWLRSKKQAIELKDDTGSCWFDLWNTEIDKYVIGDKLHLVNCFKGPMYNMSRGKFGNIIKVAK